MANFTVFTLLFRFYNRFLSIYNFISNHKSLTSVLEVRFFLLLVLFILRFYFVTIKKKKIPKPILVIDSRNKALLRHSKLKLHPRLKKNNIYIKLNTSSFTPQMRELFSVAYWLGRPASFSELPPFGPGALCVPILVSAISVSVELEKQGTAAGSRLWNTSSTSLRRVFHICCRFGLRSVQRDPWILWSSLKRLLQL